jgi:hypothetical protein
VSVTKVIRYTTKPECADENERLVRDVFAELAHGSGEQPRYAVFRLDGGVSFVHVAVLEGGENPLSTSVAFAEFQSGIRERCVEGPVAADAGVVGSYRFLPQ